ncbi:MAG: uracil-DNA glycosylase [Candidatus Spechtbacterales bacterium]
MNKAKELEKIKREVANLRTSLLYEYRKKNDYLHVMGEGSCDAKIVFVGEAPGKNEAEQGSPFCGASGRVLDKLLSVAGISRSDVYITNIVKDRPPENRDPSSEEIELYAPFLDREINIIKPAIIVTLGRFSAEYLMKKYGLIDSLAPMREIHGHSIRVKTEYGNAYLVPMYHPAASLYSKTTKEKAEKDIKILSNLLHKLS